MSQPEDARELGRRRFLHGLAGCLALPVLESFGPRSSALRAADATSGFREPDALESGTASAKRIVFVAPDYGMHPDGFFPRETGANYILPRLLKPLERHRKRFSILSQLDHPGVGGGHACSATLLNGIKISDANGDRRQLLSLDQQIAERIGAGTRFPSLRSGAGAPISYTRSGIRVPNMSDPERLFDRLFTDDSPRAKQLRQRTLVESESILDAVVEDSRRLRSRLSTQDRRKLDEYLQAVREAERKLERRRQWIDVPKPKARRRSIQDEDADDEYSRDASLFYDLLALTLQTDSSRVLVHQMPGGNRRFPFDGVSMGYHTLSHHGKRQDRIEQLAIIETFYMEQLASFLDKLAKARDEDGRPLLDSTIVMFGSGMGNASSHSSRDLPILVAGGGLQHGKHHRFEKDGKKGTPLSNLYVTLLQQLGIEADRFATSTGDLNHILT